MNNIKKLTLIMVYCTITLCMSCGRYGVDRNLHVAENIIETNPDSVLTILSTLEYSKLNEESRALYGLLYTASKYKCSLPVDRDTLIDHSIMYYRKSDDKFHLANAYYYKGSVIYTKEDFLTSAKYLKLAETICEELDDELLKNKIYERLHYLNIKIESGNLSLLYAKKFLHSSFRMNDTELIGRAFSDIATSFFLLDQVDSTAIYFNKCLPIINKLDSVSQAVIYANIGALIYENNDIQQAESLIRKSLSIKDNAYANYIMGAIEYSKRHKEDAIRCWQKALDTDDEKLKQVVHECLATYYSELNIPDKQSEHAAKELEQIKKRKIQWKANEVLEYQMEMDNKQAKEKHSISIRIVLFLLLLVLTLLLCYYFYHRYKIKRYKHSITASNNAVNQYKNEVEEQQKKILNLQTKDRSLQKKVELLMNKIKLLPQSVTNDLRTGAAIYYAIQEKRTLVNYSDEDIKKLVDFFSIIKEKTFSEWLKQYKSLTLRQYLFLIIDSMNYMDFEIAEMLGVSESAIRVTRSRLRKKKI